MAHIDFAALLPCLGSASTIWAGGETKTDLGQVVAMLLFAIAMYQWIELRFIQSRDFRPASFVKTAAALAAVTRATFLSKGFEWRLPNAQFELAHIQHYPTSVDTTSQRAHGSRRFDRCRIHIWPRSAHEAA